MNFGKVALLVPRTPYLLPPPPIFLENAWAPSALCVLFASPHTPSSDTLCSITPFGPPSPTPKFQFEIKFNFSFLNSD